MKRSELALLVADRLAIAAGSTPDASVIVSLCVNLICESRHRRVAFLPLLGGLFVQPLATAMLQRRRHAMSTISDGLRSAAARGIRSSLS
jgi:hypothetical protein